MDEATSCLDPSAEANILQRLRSNLSLSTFIVISHRLSTFSNFGRVLLLSCGRIAKDGDCGSLLAMNGVSTNLSMISTD
jgi:ABC-type bacteriocin/lantibiotic exporter with double-glycine peptidase domain